MTRDEFRTQIFERDNYVCIVCGEPAVDAHHIMERRLFQNDVDVPYGYHIDNGASLCSNCHILAEKTEIPVVDLCNILHIKRVLPSYLYEEFEYDKWGNIVLPSGMRLRGPLFQDEGVQKILCDKLSLFSKYVKHPRIHHLPQSHCITDDDRIMYNYEQLFENEEVVVSVKMDGEQTTLYDDFIHARSLSSDSTTNVKLRQSRSYIKQFHSQIKNALKDYRLCGENMQAKHSIKYTHLDSYFYVFGWWNNLTNICLSWDETTENCDILGLIPVPILYRGKFDISKILSYVTDYDISGDEMEGVVIRKSRSFSYQEFPYSIVKYVREGHVKTNNHWLYDSLVMNEIV